MKPTMKLALVAFALILTLGSVSATALPGACELRCFYPNTCSDTCMDGSAETTCYHYFGDSCTWS
jgi:hypothetical protein